jgi:DNA-directed RNA polymerase specialized sigma subunit
MKIEEMLLEYPHTGETICKLNKELNDIMQNKRQTYNTLQSSKITGIPHTTDTSDTTYNAVERLIDCYGERIRDISQQIEDAIELKEIVDICFKVLDIEERRVIELRYFQLYKWTRIPYTMKYSLSSCEKFKQSALKKMNEEYAKFTVNYGCAI